MISHTTFLELDIKNKAGSMDFETFTRYIRSQKVLEITTKFVKSLEVDVAITARELLTIYIFSYFPDDSLSTQMNSREKQMYQISQEIIDLIEILPLETTQLCSKLKEFHVCFHIWKQEDKASLLQSLAKVHTHIKSIPLDSVSTHDSDQLKSKIEKIKGFAHNIDGKQGVSHVENASKYGLTDPNQLAYQLNTQMKKAFWDILRDDLSEHPPDLTQYPPLIKDVREAIERILPQKNKDKTIEYIHNYINEDEVKQNIDQGTYNLQDIYELGNFILERIKELDSKENEDEINQRIEWLDNEIHKVKLDPNTFFADFICDLFRDIFNRLDNIESIKHEIFSTLNK